MAMFPQFGAMPGVPAAGGTAPLLSFKAGKMKIDSKGGDKFHITPDLRKGTISLFKGPDDQLMHFAWKERPSGTVVDDIIILPEEAVYKKIDTGREGERVFLMEIAGNRRFFYWMQDKSSEKDEDNMNKVNELTNSPPVDDASASRGSPGSDMMELLSSMGGGPGTSGLAGPAGGGSGAGASNEQGLNIQNLQSILQNMGFSPQEQAQATGSTRATASSSSISSSIASSATNTSLAPSVPGASAAAPAAAASTPPPPGGGGSGGRLTMEDVQRAMTSMSNMRAQAQQPPLSLNDVVDADVIEASGILDDPEIQRTLIPLMADGQQTEEELREVIRSPQLQQSLQSLSQALQSDNFNNIMSSFELDPSNPRSAESMARGDSVRAFLEAMIHRAAATRESEAAEAGANQEEKGEGGGDMDADQ